jgi:hypothetical protein
MRYDSRGLCGLVCMAVVSSSRASAVAVKGQLICHKYKTDRKSRKIVELCSP